MTDIKLLLQRNVENLADACLANAEEYHGYEDKDLVNATLVFTHFFIDAIFKENQDLSKEKQLELADTTGKAIHTLILSATGKDMPELVRRYNE